MPFTSGTYTGATQDGVHELEIRVDVGRSDLPLIPGSTGMVSGDLYSRSPRMFLYSFKAVGGTIDVAGSVNATIEIEFALPRITKESGRFTATLLSVQGGHERIQCVLQPNFSSAAIIIEAQKTSNFLRTASLETDVVQRSDGTSTREPGQFQWNNLVISVRQALQWAGVDVFEATPVREIIPANAVPTVWSEQSLANVMANHASTIISQASWRMYLLIATQFRRNNDNSTTRGIMINASGLPRQGTALFFDGCVQTSLPANFERDYIRTAVHEIGHLLDLLHTFDPLKGATRRSDTTSFMNYPQFFPGGDTNYWQAFRWQFDPDELAVIRHGTLDRVIMGGATFNSSLIDEVGFSPVAAEVPLNGLRLRLETTPQTRAVDARGRIRLFEFGEPIAIEAQLANLSSQAVEVQDTLSPVHGQTDYIIENSSGRCWRYHPIVRRCGGPRTKFLEPATKPDAQNTVYENVQLSWDARGFQMMEPGIYKIQAVHYSKYGPIFSNVLSVRVLTPSRAIEKTIAPLLQDDLAYYLGLWGAPPFASTADDLCGELMEASRDKMHPLVAEYARCRFNLESTGYHDVDEDRQQLRFVKKEPDRKVVSAVRRALGLTDAEVRQKPESTRGRRSEAKSAFPNILYGHCAKQLMQHVASSGRMSEVAENALQSAATNQLQARRVPDSVIENLWLS